MRRCATHDRDAVQGRSSFRWFASKKGGFRGTPHYTRSTRGGSIRILKSLALARTVSPFRSCSKSKSGHLFLLGCRTRSIIWIWINFPSRDASDFGPVVRDKKKARRPRPHRPVTYVRGAQATPAVPQLPLTRPSSRTYYLTIASAWFGSIKLTHTCIKY